MKRPPKAPSITVSDVAREAKVSKATAARVLGGYGRVSKTVRMAVLEAAKALDYRPNELARSMTTGRSGSIGVVVGDIENPFFSLAVRGISDAARLSGINVILANSGEEVEAEKNAIRVLLAKQVDGLIVTPAQSGDIGHLAEIACPLALLDRALPELDVDTVTVDDRDAALRATRMLTRAGHRRIAYVTAATLSGDFRGAASKINTSTVRERILGFLDACREVGIEGAERNIHFGSGRSESAHAVIQRLLRSEDRPTAILASDSVVALDLFKAIRQCGLNIPRDISLITFHDADWTSVTTPPITVIDQPVYALGKSVAELLIRRLKGDDRPPERIVLPTTIIERMSVGPSSET
ncbi:LacI family DNA-binding transcriptional regulator [Mesorhizobium sp. VK9D]|uniref:LacI family DNA-binding transcriptional regulator n=1 Tax=Mesorhizobium australafricanum TaxID=3072311 RepID=UPI002A23BE2E|nr:LacI family DNA-binding transcriptional regulator [Mesorhizobium sp. VK9D]MDX8452636.1 LacI family DNA-binding transcriptional regulator [Mesorhizobium sp. VK9D]